MITTDTSSISIRPIQPADDAEMAAIVRDVLTEFGANRPGFAWQDPELDYLTRAYGKEGYAYLVVEQDRQVLGGGGIGPFACELSSCCELQKMYLRPAMRGKQVGYKLLHALLVRAAEMGYRHCYLETLSTMNQARKLYRQTGFERLDKPLGNSGHNACDEWYLKLLDTDKTLND